MPKNFSGSQFVMPQQKIFSAADGLQIHGQLFLPRNAKSGEKLPTIVFFHGGSRRQMLLGFSPMQYYAQTYEMCQYFAAHGYAVLSVNYRSGTGYGMEFRQAQHYGAFGGSEYLDIEGAVKWLKAQPFVDAKRIGAQGVHVEEKVFPDEVHDFLLHRNWVEAYQLTAAFFDRELKNK